MSILVGMLAKQVMRQSQFSDENGRKKYRQLFVDSDEYANIKSDVDRILLKLGYQHIVSDK